MMLKAGPGAPLLDVARKASQKQARRNHRSTGLRFCMFRLPAEDAAFLLRLLPLKIGPVGNQKIGVGGDALHPAVFRVSHAAEEIHQPAGGFPGGLLHIEDHHPSGGQMIRRGARLIHPAELHQHGAVVVVPQGEDSGLRRLLDNLFLKFFFLVVAHKAMQSFRQAHFHSRPFRHIFTRPGSAAAVKLINGNKQRCIVYYSAFPPVKQGRILQGRNLSAFPVDKRSFQGYND